MAFVYGTSAQFNPEHVAPLLRISSQANPRNPVRLCRTTSSCLSQSDAAAGCFRASVHQPPPTSLIRVLSLRRPAASTSYLPVSRSSRSNFISTLSSSSSVPDTFRPTTSFCARRCLRAGTWLDLNTDSPTYLSLQAEQYHQREGFLPCSLCWLSPPKALFTSTVPSIAPWLQP